MRCEAVNDHMHFILYKMFQRVFSECGRWALTTDQAGCNSVDLKLIFRYLLCQRISTLSDLN